MNRNLTTTFGKLRSRRPLRKKSLGFTLLELLVVIVVFVVVAALIGTRTGTFSFWNEETALRRLSETLSFLHFQALADQSYYQLEFDLDNNSYRAQALRDDNDILQTPGAIAAAASMLGNLSLELSLFMNPAIGKSGTFIPPPNYPSMAEPTILPEGMTIEDIVTVRGTIKPGNSSQSEDNKAYIRFSPRGVSEFGVIHLRESNGREVTILVNPFTGVPQLFRERREFEWTLGKNKDTMGS